MPKAGGGVEQLVAAQRGERIPVEPRRGPLHPQVALLVHVVGAEASAAAGRAGRPVHITPSYTWKVW